MMSKSGFVLTITTHKNSHHKYTSKYPNVWIAKIILSLSLTDNYFLESYLEFIKIFVINTNSLLFRFILFLLNLKIIFIKDEPWIMRNTKITFMLWMWGRTSKSRSLEASGIRLFSVEWKKKNIPSITS